MLDQEPQRFGILFEDLEILRSAGDAGFQSTQDRGAFFPRGLQAEPRRLLPACEIDQAFRLLLGVVGQARQPLDARLDGGNPTELFSVQVREIR